MDKKKSPLVEAVLEIVFKNNLESYDSTLPGLFYNKVKKEFPEKIDAQNVDFQIKTEDGTVRKISAPLTRFSNDKGSLIQLTKDLIVFNKIGPNITWKSLKSTVLKNINHFIDVNSNNVITLITLKYLNVLELGDKPTFSDLFNFALPRPSGDKYIGMNKVKLECSYTINSQIVEVSMDRIKYGKDQRDAIMLEISVDSNDSEQEYNEKSLEQWIEKAHDTICEVFQDHVNDKHLKTYGK